MKKLFFMSILLLVLTKVSAQQSCPKLTLQNVTYPECQYKGIIHLNIEGLPDGVYNDTFYYDTFDGKAIAFKDVNIISGKIEIAADAGEYGNIRYGQGTECENVGDVQINIYMPLPRFQLPIFCSLENKTLKDVVVLGSEVIWFKENDLTTPIEDLNIPLVEGDKYSFKSECLLVPYTVEVESVAKPILSADCTLGAGKAKIIIQNTDAVGYVYSLNGGAFQSSLEFIDVPDGTHIITTRNPVSECESVTSIRISSYFPKIRIIKMGSISNVNNKVMLDASSVLMSDYSIKFNWDTQDGVISDGRNASVATLTAAGTYTLTITNRDGCFAKETIVIVNEVSDPIVNIPDYEFKRDLVDSTINSNKDGEIQVSEALNVKSMGVVFSRTIFDMGDYRCIGKLEGLQYFKNLTELYLNGSDTNYCVSSEPVDLSGLKYLTKFECAEGGCSYVNLDNSLSLKDVNVQGNSSNNFRGCYDLETFTTRNSYLDLDFTNYTKLKSIYSMVSIDSLIVKGCTSLETVYLEADYNIKSFDFSDCINLKSLFIGEAGRLSELNLSNVNKLEKITVHSSGLNNLNLSNMPNLKYALIGGVENLNIKNGSLFTAEPISENNYAEGFGLEFASDLKTICVDEGEYEFIKSLVEKYGYNSTITTDCTNLSVSENELNTLNITFSPNPTQGKITFTEKVDEVKVFDLSGRLVKTNTVNTTEVDLSDLQKGVYMMQVSQNNKTLTSKVVKE